MKLTGSNAHAYLGFFDEQNVVPEGQNLSTGKLYFILRKRGGADGLLGDLPEETFYKAVSAETVGPGNRFLEIDPEQLFKTSADFSMEQGVVDVGEDCDPSARMLDGIVTISGSVSGLFRYSEDYGSFEDVTETVIDHFMAAVREDETGRLDYRPRKDTRVFLLLLLNANAQAGQYENWLYVPIVISSLSGSFGNTEAQTRDISWTKGEGRAIRYAVKKAG